MEGKDLSFNIDSVTGFLEDKMPEGIKAKHKTAFLKALKTHGNQSKAAHDLGFSYRILELHLRKDLIFKEAYEETLLEMRHKLEGELYKTGLMGKSKEALSWLSAHFPLEYGPVKKQQPSKKDNSQEIDKLFSKLD